MVGENTTDQRSLASAPTLTRIARLQNDRQYRDKHKLYFIEGVRSFVAALDQGCTVDTLLYSERLLTAPVARKLVRRLKRAGVPFAQLSPEEFRSISHSERASGIAAIVRQRLLDIEQTAPGNNPCWVVLNQVRAPGNFGTLIRSSAAIGGAGFILLDNSNRIDPFDPNVIRASMGAFFGQKFVRATTEQLGQWVQQHNLLVIGASPDGKVPYNEVVYTQPTVLIFGEERKGLNEAQRSLCHHLVRIPMLAGTDSLNLGVAGSLLMYEVVRGVQLPP